MHSNFNDLKTTKMTAKELLEEEKFGYDHFTKLTSTGIEPDEDNIAEFAEEYHKRKLKLLGIGDVVGQSELLVCFEYDSKGMPKCKTQCTECDEAEGGKQKNCR